MTAKPQIGGYYNPELLHVTRLLTARIRPQNRQTRATKHRRH